jgi:glutamate N-acetyltransferase/amino-acid N-acetyltransferase
MWSACGGGVTAAPGFRAGAAAAGIRYQGRDDVALVVAERTCAAAGVFTTNRVQAAPVIVSREHLAGGVARACVINAGCANCGTGAAGLDDARAMAREAALAVDCPPEQVVVASTGVIGSRLPMDRVAEGIRAAAARLSPAGGEAAARAIMTTDTRPKQAAVRGHGVTIGGMAKGVGMIHPNMATMLAFVTSDAAVAAADLRAVVRRVAERTFNCVSVDGDQSTNDTFVVLCSGERPIAPEAFEAGLLAVCTDLARQLAADGEGATRLLEVAVRGAASDEDARRAARAVVASNLVKAAVFGRDANWGRILCALGNAGVAIDPGRVALRIGPLQVAAGGVQVPFDEAEASRLLGADVVRFDIDLGLGGGSGTAWGCDLTYDYVKINGSYRS